MSAWPESTLLTPVFSLVVLAQIWTFIAGAGGLAGLVLVPHTSALKELKIHTVLALIVGLSLVAWIMYLCIVGLPEYKFVLGAAIASTLAVTLMVHAGVSGWKLSALLDRASKLTRPIRVAALAVCLLDGVSLVLFLAWRPALFIVGPAMVFPFAVVVLHRVAETWLRVSAGFALAVSLCTAISPVYGDDVRLLSVRAAAGFAVMVFFGGLLQASGRRLHPRSSYQAT
jgi:hypothetical protein